MMVSGVIDLVAGCIVGAVVVATATVAAVV